MNFLYLVIVGIVICLAFVLVYPFWKPYAPACFGVSCAINANFFNIGTYPLVVGPLIFGLDSVLYSLFIFAVIFVFLKQDKKNAMNLMLSAIAAILILAFVQLIANFSSNNFSNFIWSIGSHLTSATATFSCILIMLYFAQKIKNKKLNDYLNIVISMLIAIVIDSIIYFGLTFALTGSLGANFLLSLSASFIGKVMTIAFACLTYYLVNLVEKKLKAREINKKK